MKIVTLIIAIPAFIFITAVQIKASDNGIDARFEFGRRGSSGLVEEEDLKDEFNFSRYTVRADREIDKKNSYYAAYQYYTKSFDTLKNNTNNLHLAGFGTDNIIYSSGEYWSKIGPDFEYRDKHYAAADKSFDQLIFDIPFILKKDKDWSILFAGGINSFIFDSAPKNELRTSGKIEFTKKFMDEALTLEGFIRYRYVSRENRSDRYERNLGGSGELKVGSDFLKSISGGIEHGMDNTKIMYEEREDNYDYNFVTWYARAKVAFLNIFTDTVKYSHTRRNYDNFKDNFDGSTVENALSASIMEKGDLKAELKLEYKYKQYRFPYVSDPYSFHSHFIKPTMELLKKNDWKVWLGEDTKLYDYQANKFNNKIYYTAIFGCEKFFMKKDLVLGFEYLYTFKNFLHKIDITEDVFRIRASYKF